MLSRAGELLRGEQVDSAEREVNEALKLAPDDVRAKNLLGLVRFRGGRFDEAHQVYRELVARDPDDTALRLNLGLVELRLGRNGEAAQSLKRVVEKEDIKTFLHERGFAVQWNEAAEKKDEKPIEQKSATVAAP